MVHLSRNKSELLVLTGAVYSFVAYLIAFTIEVLFLVDLARRTNDILSKSNLESNNLVNSRLDSNALQDNTNNNDPSLFTDGLLNFESLQAHITISCLIIAIFYFIVFVASLVLIVALILRSTFMLLVWMCAMTTMYLPEFGLVVYVTFYGWGVGTRNGQTELVFYLFRAILNLLFIYRTYKLFKQWSYEKNFFRLKTGSNFTGYDSPYFVGDSLTTTINPVFSSSTLNLHRYDRVRDSSSKSPTANSIYSVDYDYNQINKQQRNKQRDQRARLATASMYTHDVATKNPIAGKYNDNYGFDVPWSADGRNGYHVGGSGAHDNHPQNRPTSRYMDHNTSGYSNCAYGTPQPFASTLSINDDLDEFELDIDYRTLTHSRRNRPSSRQQQQQQQHHHHQQQQQQHQQPVNARSPDGMSYSTQSLDRRNLREYGPLTEQVVLRPLGHQPFEYIQRLGSTSNLNTANILNTQPPSIYSSNPKLPRRLDLNPNNPDDNHRF